MKMERYLLQGSSIMVDGYVGTLRYLIEPDMAMAPRNWASAAEEGPLIGDGLLHREACRWHARCRDAELGLLALGNAGTDPGNLHSGRYEDDGARHNLAGGEAIFIGDDGPQPLPQVVVRYLVGVCRSTGDGDAAGTAFGRRPNRNFGPERPIQFRLRGGLTPTSCLGSPFHLASP